jgi:hypothetical protein
MTRFGIGWVGAAAFATLAYAGSTQSAKSSSGASAASTAAAKRDAKPAATASGTAGSASTGGPTRVVVGRVELLDRANHVTVSGTERAGLAFDKFKIDQGTEITVNGERASVAEVNPGDEVRASFSGKGDDARLERLEILPSGE